MSQKKINPKNGKFRRGRNRNNVSLYLMLGGVGIVAIALFAILLGKPTPKAPIEVNGAPSLKVDKEKIDLGNETLGQNVSATFTLTNVGDQPLRFSEAPYIEVKEGC